MKKRHSAEVKAKAALALVKGEKTAVEIARELSCHPTLIGMWRDRLLKEAEHLFEGIHANDEKQEKIATLEQMVGRLTVQLEFAKKVSGSFTSR
jgi:transposase